jgi:hypothetical protein
VLLLRHAGEAALNAERRAHVEPLVSLVPS